MDGVHDLGGIQGFGPIEIEDDHVPSKSDWGVRSFAIQLSASYPGGFSVDWIRHVAQCIPPAAYLEIEYYDRWYRMVAGVLLDGGEPRKHKGLLKRHLQHPRRIFVYIRSRRAINGREGHFASSAHRRWLSHWKPPSKA